MLINQAVVGMVNEGRGRLFGRKDSKYAACLPKELLEDSLPHFNGTDTIFVKVSFSLDGSKLLVEKWRETRTVSSA